MILVFTEMLYEDWKRRKILIQDPHFRPYYMNNNNAPCKNLNDLIIRQENLSEDLGFIFDHLNISLPEDSFTTKFHSTAVSGEFDENQAKFKKNFDKLTMKTRQKLFEIFEPDLQILDYKWDLETNLL